MNSPITPSDTQAYSEQVNRNPRGKFGFLREIPFVAVHLGCLGVFFVGVSKVAAITAFVLYFIRMFAITGFYHRYFSHKTFKTSRFMQWVFAVLGASATQKGPIWWAAHHRQHHLFSDQEGDPHSPVKDGFFKAHIGWVFSAASKGTNLERVRDLYRFPELRVLDRYYGLVPFLLALSLYIFGEALAASHPELGTSGWQMLVWGFFISTTAVLHCTFLINSATHCFGKKRFITKDQSRNNPLLALLTLGEGWHNNHHRYPASTRQGFYWWEYDITYYLLVVLQKLGIIWDLKPVPVAILEEGRTNPARRQNKS